MNIAVIGSGSWGTALAAALSKNRSYRINLWVSSPRTYKTIILKRCNDTCLPGIRLSGNIRPTMDQAEAVQNRKMVILAVPSRDLRVTVQDIRPFLGPLTCLVNAAKGLEPETHLRLSQVIAEELPAKLHGNITLISGPGHAEEAARQVPSVIAVASPSSSPAGRCSSSAVPVNPAVLFNSHLPAASPLSVPVEDAASGPAAADSAVSGPAAAEPAASGAVPAPSAVVSAVTEMLATAFIPYYETDAAGTELGGALSNVIALGCGICEGLNAGANAHSRFFAAFFREAISLGRAFGAKPATFLGPAGLGDFFSACTSSFSRNRVIGIKLGEGKRLSEIMSANRNAAAEGIATLRSAYSLTRSMKIYSPAISTLYRIMFEGKDPFDITEIHDI